MRRMIMLSICAKKGDRPKRVPAGKMAGREKLCEKVVRKAKKKGILRCRIPLFYARSTLPDFRQDVHTYIFFAAPFTFTLTDLIFDFHILLDLLWEWLTLFPK